MNVSENRDVNPSPYAKVMKKILKFRFLVELGNLMPMRGTYAIAAQAPQETHFLSLKLFSMVLVF